MISCAFEDGSQASLRHVAVDNLVLDQGKILLVKRTGKLLEGNKWGLVGGFVERNETIKEAAVREIKEETGYNVIDVTLLRIIDTPNRPAEDRQNIAFVNFCTVGEKTGDADWESSDQRWFDLDAIPPKEQIAFDHYESIKLFLTHNTSPLTLPVLG
jgi:8-oxo-dGTP diphosphatase